MCLKLDQRQVVFQQRHSVLPVSGVYRHQQCPLMSTQGIVWGPFGSAHCHHVLFVEQSLALCWRHSSLHVISFCAFAQLAWHSSLRSRRHATRSAMRYITRHDTRHVVRHDIRSSSSSPSAQSSRQSSRQNSASAARRWRSRRWLCTASDSSHWTTLRMVSDRHSKGSQLFMVFALISVAISLVIVMVVVTKIGLPKWCPQVVLLVWRCFYTQPFRVLSQWPSCEVRQLINHCRIDLRRVTWRCDRSHVETFWFRERLVLQPCIRRHDVMMTCEGSDFWQHIENIYCCTFSRH